MIHEVQKQIFSIAPEKGTFLKREKHVQLTDSVEIKFSTTFWTV